MKLNELIRSNEPVTVLFTITPSIAQEMLSYNTSNRPVSNSTVKRYVEVMKRDGWYLNAVPIVFSTTGTLLDGQHRLLAVVESNCTIKSMVSGGIDPKAFASFDNGRSRSLGQLIGIDQVKNYNAVAAVVKGYYALCNKSVAYETKTKRFDVSACKRLVNSDWVEIYNKDADKYNEYGSIATRLANQMRKAPITGATAASIWMYLVEHHGYDFDFVANFFNQLYSLKTPDVHVIQLLWSKLLDMRIGGNLVETMQYKMNLLAKTWNYYATDKDVKTLSVSKQDNIEFITAAQANNVK